MLIRTKLIQIHILIISIANAIPLLSQTGLQMDSIRFTKMILRDSNYLEHILHKDLKYTHSNGSQESKELHIQNIMRGHIIYDSFQFIKSYYSKKEDFIIGQGEVLVHGKFNKIEPFSVRLQFSNIYLRRKKGYRLLYWQSTKLK